MHKLKHMLKYVWPASSNTFNAFRNEFKKDIEKNSNLVTSTRKDIDNVLQELFNQFKKLNEQQQSLANELHILQEYEDSVYSKQKQEIESTKQMMVNYQKLIEQKIDQLKNIIPNKEVKWANEFERRIVHENWGDVSKDPSFADRFKRLIYGLDAESITTIVRILKRQQIYLNNNSKEINLFTRAEQEELRLLKENFDAEILKISDDLYAYRNYLLPINHFESSVFYFKHGIHQIDTLEYVKGKAIVDVGGFIGDSILVLSELSPSKIYTFEAVPNNFKLLQQTIQINHIENVVAENIALGEKAGSCNIHVSGSASSVIERIGISYKEDIEIPIITLDEYVEKHKIEIGLIKVDIEGGEPAFLAGAKETICKQRPILLISIYHNAHDFFELKPLIESWDLGYRFKIHKPTYGNITSETLLLAEVIK